MKGVLAVLKKNILKKIHTFRNRARSATGESCALPPEKRKEKKQELLKRQYNRE